MELLDLEQHDPEDYEGKFIVIYDCIYEIGSMVSMGTEKIVHKTRNVRSGLSMHVLKIQRAGLAGMPALDFYYGMKSKTREFLLAERFDEPLFQEVDSMVVPTGHGLMELQLNASVASEMENPGSPTFSRMVEAGRLYKEDRLEQALAIFLEVLQENPHHTNALHSAASIKAHNGDYRDALDLEIRACSVEPNTPMYLISTVSLGLAAGDLQSSVNAYSALKRKFPYENCADVSAIRMYLELGLPEEAALIRHQELPMLDEERMSKLDAQINDKLRDKGSAAIWFARARSCVLGAEEEDYGSATRYLRKALAIYPKYLDAAINLGLVLAASGECEEAESLLLYALQLAPISFSNTLVTNLAYVKIGNGKLSEGAAILGEVFTELADDVSELMAISPESFPKPARWLGWHGVPHLRNVLETRDFLKDSVARSGDPGETPPVIAALIEIFDYYERHLENLQDNLSRRWSEMARNEGPGKSDS